MSMKDSYEIIKGWNTTAFSVGSDDCNKAKKVLEEAGVDYSADSISNSFAVATLQEKGVTKQKIMERIPEGKRNENINTLMVVGGVRDEIEKYIFDNKFVDDALDKSIENLK